MKSKAELNLAMKNSSLCLTIIASVVLVGCQESQPPLSPPVVTLPPSTFDPNVDAGWGKGVVVGDATLVANLKTRTSGNLGQSFSPRNDPFALLGEERSFEAQQSSERVFSESGWRFDYEAPPPVDVVDTLEPQPYRRLAGVIVGESVLALIDMGDGRLEIIRPGQRIPNSEWIVVSIDEDKAVLRRPGNRLPRQIVVRLESPPAGFGGTPSGGGQGGSNGVPGGVPPGRGGPPAGVPGGAPAGGDR